MTTLRSCYDKLITKFVEFAVGLFPDNDEIKAALAQLTLAPMLMICFKVKQHLAPNFIDGKIDPKPLAEAFKIDVKAISDENLKRLNDHIETLIMLSDEVINAANQTISEKSTKA